MPGVRIGDLSVGGLSIAVARQRLEDRLDTVENAGLVLRSETRDVPLQFTAVDAKGFGLTNDIVQYDLDATLASAIAFGRSGSPLRTTVDQFRGALFGFSLQPAVSIDDPALSRAIGEAVAPLETPPVEPGFRVAKNGTVSTTPPSAGKLFDHSGIERTVRNRIGRLSTDPIPVALRQTEAGASSADAAQLVADVRTFVQRGSLRLTANKRESVVRSSTYLAWLRPARSEQRVVLGLDEDAVATFIETLMPTLSIPPQNAKFALRDGAVAELQPSRPGSGLDRALAVAAIANAVRDGQHDVALPVHDVAPQATSATIVGLGIRELVAVGTTNFAGSPTNRRHNIAVASDLLNGTLIAAGEEFSLIKAVGPVDASLGYRQELVIKGDRTIPEFGGGLCQIGTTMFRVVLNAGLPVLERQNHSYRVRYYEPPVGMDATIYEPKPDFRFRNDFVTPLLLQTRIEGDNLIFEFWGTKDGRVASTTQPKVSNVVPPPPKLTIETTDLPPGTVKCTERPHPGSDAAFTYTVTFADGRSIDTVFKSKYRPWREVCLVGVKPAKDSSDDEPEPSGTNTNASPAVNVNATPAAN